MAGDFANCGIGVNEEVEEETGGGDAAAPLGSDALEKARLVLRLGGRPSWPSPWRSLSALTAPLLDVRYVRIPYKFFFDIVDHYQTGYRRLAERDRRIIKRTFSSLVLPERGFYLMPFIRIAGGQDEGASAFRLASDAPADIYEPGRTCRVGPVYLMLGTGLRPLSTGETTGRLFASTPFQAAAAATATATATGSTATAATTYYYRYYCFQLQPCN
ncbi:hypothetical protein V1478_002502 [Vespula squamosa]|uniref:Uncharacterized protein n=1 Tax=Vespula squamosa TaxID=30214 RepID=A0ABD2BSR6_VESSQ